MGRLPELTERDTEPEGVRDAMTVPAFRDVPSVRGSGRKELDLGRDDVANVGPRVRRRAQGRDARGWQDVCWRSYMLLRVGVPAAGLT